jgi:hypothetical protein
MIDTLIKPPRAENSEDDDSLWLRQRQRADTNTESETITGQESDDNDLSDDVWDGDDKSMKSPSDRLRTRSGHRLHRSNQDPREHKRGLDDTDDDGSDSERGSGASRRSEDGTRVRRRHSSCDHGQRVSDDFEEVESSSNSRHKRKTNPLSVSSERELSRSHVKKNKARSSRGDDNDDADDDRDLAPVDALRKRWAKGELALPLPC